MNEATYQREMALNRTAYEAGLREKIRRDYRGQYVALADGRIVAGGSDYDQVVAAVRKLVPVPEHYLVFPADEDPDFEPYLSS